MRSLGLLLLMAVGCGGQTASVDTRGATEAGAPPSQDASTTRDASSSTNKGNATCLELGCTTGFTCVACGPELVCDDLHGHAACASVETFASCGAGTMFCNSSCGVCLLPGAPCVMDSCGPEVTKCLGASCGPGTRCDGGRCVPR